VAQYVGFSDLFGRIVSELPNYGYRFGRFLLDLIRRVVGNPVGFVTTVVGIALGAYLIDKWFDGLLQSLQVQVQGTIQTVSNQLTNAPSPSCSLTNILGCIEGGLLFVVKWLFSNVFSVVIQGILTLIAYLIAGVRYIVEWNMYVLCYVLCYYVQPMFSSVTGAYVGVKVLTGMWKHMLSGGVGKFIITPFAGLGSTLVTYALANSFMNYVLNMVGISCSPQAVQQGKGCTEPPPLSLTIQLITPPSTPKSPWSGNESVAYNLTFGAPSLLSSSGSERVGYGLNVVLAPKPRFSGSEYVSYVLRALPPGVSTMSNSSSEASKYLLSVSAMLGRAFMGSETVSYSLSVSVTTPTAVICVCSFNGCICNAHASASPLIQSPVVVGESVSTSAG